MPLKTGKLRRFYDPERIYFLWKLDDSDSLLETFLKLYINTSIFKASKCFNSYDFIYSQIFQFVRKPICDIVFCVMSF